MRTTGTAWWALALWTVTTQPEQALVLSTRSWTNSATSRRTNGGRRWKTVQMPCPSWSLPSRSIRSVDLSLTSVELMTMTVAFTGFQASSTLLQDPQQADKLTKIQKDLDETKITLHQTIESVLQRGEKLENLVDKSQDLSMASQMFYKQARKNNQCCKLM